MQPRDEVWKHQWRKIKVEGDKITQVWLCPATDYNSPVPPWSQYSPGERHKTESHQWIIFVRLSQSLQERKERCWAHLNRFTRRWRLVGDTAAAGLLLKLGPRDSRRGDDRMIDLREKDGSPFLDVRFTGSSVCRYRQIKSSGPQRVWTPERTKKQRTGTGLTDPARGKLAVLMSVWRSGVVWSQKFQQGHLESSRVWSGTRGRGSYRTLLFFNG